MSRRLSRREKRLIFIEGVASGVAFAAASVGMVLFMLAW
jgi:hypothetical protein|tara:strand:- start:654 stop:770 length:117 start_codon:yes stop_codon:yes gene_type:complete